MGLVREAWEGLPTGSHGWNLMGEVLMEPKAAALSLSCGLLPLLFLLVRHVSG